jgi:hypothetical protein
MMGTNDIEKLLKKARLKHLSEATLVSYNDDQLDRIELALANVHLRLCHICERKLNFLKGETEALNNSAITDADPTSNEQSIKKKGTKLAPRVSAELERLKSYVEDLRDAWTIPFRKQAMRGATDSDEVWRYESEDGLLTGWAVLDQQANLIVRFSSPELSWEGFRLRFTLGPFSKEIALQIEKNKVTAKVVVPRRERAKKMSDISIEVIPAP